jgi:L,D-transpeptidase YcbB
LVRLAGPNIVDFLLAPLRLSRPHARSLDWLGTRTPNFTMRQRSGTWNALGAVKTDMPNPYSVYMHDTNQRNLFSDDYRFDSHDFIRRRRISPIADRQ